MTSPFILSILTNYIFALIAMAFYTLLERKALGYFQLRKGPNKVGLSGLPQPFADAIKLFAKEQALPFTSNPLPFLLAPIASLILALLLWSLLPSSSPSFFIKLGALAFLCISSLNIYTTLAAGWTSNSKYALLGAIRSIAQTISYEVSMALILLSSLCILMSFNFAAIQYTQSLPPALILTPLFFSWFITTLAETNRTPFDLAEGESELVSGFNIEYSAGNFALIFMAEYTSIIIMSLITTAIWAPTPLNFNLTMDFIFTSKSMFFAFLFIWMRATLPRMRYDQLMSLTWKSFLPFSLIFLFLAPAINLYMI